MKINSENVIEFLISKIPSLSKAPGFDDEDISSPYVAFASFVPFVIADEDLLNSFMREVSSLYEKEYQDQELINLFKIEIFENFHRLGEEKILEYAGEKMKKDFSLYLNSLNRRT